MGKSINKIYWYEILTDIAMHDVVVAACIHQAYRDDSIDAWEIALTDCIEYLVQEKEYYKEELLKLRQSTVNQIMFIQHDSNFVGK